MWAGLCMPGSQFHCTAICFVSILNDSAESEQSSRRVKSNQTNSTLSTCHEDFAAPWSSHKLWMLRPRRAPKKAWLKETLLLAWLSVTPTDSYESDKVASLPRQHCQGIPQSSWRLWDLSRSYLYNSCLLLSKQWKARHYYQHVGWLSHSTGNQIKLIGCTRPLVFSLT